MAELLVKAVSATLPDPTVTQTCCYQRGDVVVVAPNSWSWGQMETLPPAQGGQFVVLKITDVTVAQVRNWVQENWNCRADSDDLDANGNLVRRRRVQISVSLLPSGVRTTLNQTGTYSTTWVQVRDYVFNKLTNATASGATI